MIMKRASEVTHKIMSSIKSKDTAPELLLIKSLCKMKLRYRKNYKELPGKPDIVFLKAKIAIFCDGDFWHGHNWALRGLTSLDEELKQYSEFWQAKIKYNIARDIKNNELLKNEGWLVIRFWESEIKKDAAKCALRVAEQYYLRATVTKDKIEYDE